MSISKSIPPWDNKDKNDEKHMKNNENKQSNVVFTFDDKGRVDASEAVTNLLNDLISSKEKVKFEYNLKMQGT